VAVVRQTDNKGIKSFPNPVASQLNIEFANAKGTYIISMFNQTGQEVQSTRANIENSTQYVTLQRKNLTAGNYFVRITNIATGEVHTEKIILQ
jgi:methionine-rich copper-binding protein CopC